MSEEGGGAEMGAGGGNKNRIQWKRDGFLSGQHQPIYLYPYDKFQLYFRATASILCAMKQVKVRKHLSQNMKKKKKKSHENIVI
jgi:hypothetical protein